MIEFIFTEKAKLSFLKLEKDNQDRIILKLKYLKTHPNILSVMKRIEYFEPVTHRLRIGQYRILLQLLSSDNEDYKFRIVKVEHRRDIYR